jgi:hypothetical protein
MKLGVLLVGSLVVTSPAFAQAATVAVFAPSVTNPNAATPISSAVYSPNCNQAFVAQSATLTNPTEGRYADPANAARDCLFNLTAQVAALPVGTGYKGAIKLGTGLYGPLTSAFAVAAAQAPHECDSTPASPASVNVAQAFTIGWCHSGTNVTGWRVYRNGVLQTVTVTPGATTNAAGDRYYTISRSEAAAATNVVYEVSGLNGVTEAARVTAATLNVVQPPPPAPAPITRPRITVP